MLDDATARRLIDDSEFVWHQQFHLSENVLTPGAANIEWLIQRVGLPLSLEGRTFLDVGTTNGGAAFIAEARGADRVVAVDIYDPDNFGFDTLRDAVGSRAEFVKGTIYELPQVLNEQFDEVFFLGVLYHLRHPLLALDSLRRLTRGNLYVETAVSGSPTDEPSARFFRRDELGWRRFQLVRPHHQLLGGLGRVLWLRGRSGGSLALGPAGAGIRGCPSSRRSLRSSSSSAMRSP